ncbi:glycerol-3-phosphate dehydrogenase/oxidase [Oceanobacillus salinisoli]|uniref:glycerol-3-phosphate dehydrogenase/oxidase n=1 Tax=Oceanobacillus salinisoli TaxID=2678611 RepID=UPI0012E0EE5B|nr:FAD-dependent oxidoreductase [Oceanobacillus salinisoli]
MKLFSSHQRDTINQNFKKVTLDLLVIGGGITGAGISLDAVTRGLNTGLIEMQDFAAGTSSRSTKLVHGGLRYLQQFEFKMVSEVGKERAIVYENGPHVTTPEWMMLPLYKGSTLGPVTTNIGLRIYDFLAGVKKEERRVMLNPDQAIEKEPLIKKQGLKGAGYYVEYKTDDARLTIEVLKKAVEKGVHAINYTKAIDFLYDESNKICGVLAEDQITGERHKVFAKKVVNASGPWVDGLREKDGSKQGKALHLTKGIHLVFSKEVFPLNQAIYFDAPDGRMIFAIPRGKRTYVGTTDTTYKGDLTNPQVTDEDLDYLLMAIDFMFPSLKLNESHVESSWAGLRPLIAENGKGDNPSEISRKDEVFVSDSGLISIAGGKLTGYRQMALQIVNLVVKQLKEEEGILYSDSVTKNLPISGGEVGGSKGYQRFKGQKLSEGMTIGLKKEDALKLIETYGSNVSVLFNLYQDKFDEAVKEGMDPIVLSQLIYAMEYELAYKPVDFFIRRTGALFFDIEWVNQHKEKVINYMQKSLNWSNKQKNLYSSELEQSLHEAVTPLR